MTDEAQKIIDAAHAATDAAIDTILTTSLPAPADHTFGVDESTSYPDEFAQLELNEQEWARLERSHAGEVLKAAWAAARPILVPMAQEAGKDGVAFLFSQLAGRIASK